MTRARRCASWRASCVPAGASPRWSSAYPAGLPPAEAPPGRARRTAHAGAETIVRAAPQRPAFYALAGGRAGELLTLLHPPYTAWHLSYFALGAAVAPHVHLDRLLWGLAAFALAVGVAAHALDELHDRPLGTSLSDRALIAVAASATAGAVAIGVAGAITVTGALAPLVLAGALFLPA